MTKIIQNVDLSTGLSSPVIEGYEPCAASGFDVALTAGNHYAAFSSDQGSSFQRISPHDMAALVGETFCCDQRLDYVPSIDNFVWTLQSSRGSIIIAVNSTQKLKNSDGKHWYYYHLTPEGFGIQGKFDFPQVSFGKRFLYIATEVVGAGSLIVRIPLVQLQQHVTLAWEIVRTAEGGVTPCQLTGDPAWFATLLNDSMLRVYGSVEQTGSWNHFDVAIARIPTRDFSSLTPEDDDWLPPTSKIQTRLTGAARSGSDLWLAWSAGRKFSDDSPSVFTQPHIEIAVIDLRFLTLLRQEYIWNREFAFAWPSLAANLGRPRWIGISFDYGGGRLYPQHAVGTLYPGRHLLRTTNAPRSSGAGGHYNDIRMNYPMTHQFVTAGFVQSKDGGSPATKMNRPHYVVFEPSLGT